MLFFICRTKRNKKEVFALNASMLLDKLIEKNLSINRTLEICERLCELDKVTIGDAIWIKGELDLTDFEAVKIFLS